MLHVLQSRVLSKVFLPVSWSIRRNWFRTSISLPQEGHLARYVRYSLSMFLLMFIFNCNPPDVEKVSLTDLVARVRNGENLEVIGYEGNAVLVERPKGVVKGDFAKEELSELKKRKPRGKPTEEQLELAAEVARRLGEAKKPFKIIFGPKEVTIRTGNGFIRVAEDGVKLAGYKSLEEDPIPLVIEILRSYGEVKLLRPLK